MQLYSHIAMLESTGDSRARAIEIDAGQAKARLRRAYHFYFRHEVGTSMGARSCEAMALPTLRRYGAIVILRSRALARRLEGWPRVPFLILRGRRKGDGTSG